LYYSSPKRYGWIWPALLFVLARWLTSTYAIGAFVQLGAAISIVLGAWTLYNCANCILSVWLDAHERIRQAQTNSEEVRRLELATHIHPETLRMLYQDRNRAWMIKAGMEVPGGEPYSVLASAPMVTDMFIAYVLDNSSTAFLMAKRTLADKAYTFDPMGETQDYQQYDAFLAWLKLYNMVTDAGPASPPAWIAPYCPEVVARSLGWDWEGHGLKELEA
jgi:hypothetical protein